MSEIGHNSAHADVLDGSAQSNLRAIVERIERADAERAEAAAYVREIYAEAKAFGFDVKTLRKAVKIRAQDRAKRQEEEAILDLYLSALGLI